MPILGIDEVGRGPLAGPLVMGAVVLEDATAEWCQELTDSKKLTAKKREELEKIILEKAAGWALGWVEVEEINERGMSEALRLATRRAVEGVQKQKVSFSEIIIDGTVNFLKGTRLENYVSTMKKADFLIKEVSAASIIAKVARDRYMYKIVEKYPEYGFQEHVGYGTARHMQALAKLGPCPEHRTSFRPVREALICSTEIGKKAEGIVAEYLVKNGHEIIARNYKTKLYEIDIISAYNEKIYFTEVKYRRNQGWGSAEEMVTAEKLRQMKFAAKAFLSRSEKWEKYQPLLAVGAVQGDFELEKWEEILD